MHSALTPAQGARHSLIQLESASSPSHTNVGCSNSYFLIR